MNGSNEVNGRPVQKRRRRSGANGKAAKVAGVGSGRADTRKEVRDLILELDSNPATVSQRLAVVDRLDFEQLHSAKSSLLHLQRTRAECAKVEASAFTLIDAVAVRQ